MQDAVEIDPRILQAFSAWFDVDLIDLADTDEMSDLADTAAADLMGRGLDAGDIIRNLSAALERWTSHVAMQFVRVTNVDWLFNQATEDQLRCILAKTIASAEALRTQAPRASVDTP